MISIITTPQTMKSVIYNTLNHDIYHLEHFKPWYLLFTTLLTMISIIYNTSNHDIYHLEHFKPWYLSFATPKTMFSIIYNTSNHILFILNRIRTVLKCSIKYYYQCTYSDKQKTLELEVKSTFRLKLWLHIV